MGRGKTTLSEDKFPDFTPISPTTRIIEDLVRCLDNGGTPKGGVRAARAGTELIFAIIESHLKGGARVTLPLVNSALGLDRSVKPKQPKFAAKS